MELRHLRYFVAIAEEKNFTHAAQRLHVAQPALSRQIKDLEQELQTQLFKREHGGVRLTNAGEIFFRHAREILQKVSDAVHETQVAAGAVVRRLTLGFLGSYHLRFLEPLLASFRENHPEVEFDFFPGNLSTQLKALRDGQIDIAFVNLPASLDDLQYAVVHKTPFMAAVPKGHRLARRKTVAVKDLAQEGFVISTREARPEFYDRVISICAQAGFKPRIVRTVAGPPSNVTGLVSLGLGVTLMPYFPDTSGSPNVSWRPLQDPAPMLEFAIVWAKADRAALVTEFANQARELLSDLPDLQPVAEI